MYWGVSTLVALDERRSDRRGETSIPARGPPLDSEYVTEVAGCLALSLYQILGVFSNIVAHTRSLSPSLYLVYSLRCAGLAYGADAPLTEPEPTCIVARVPESPRDGLEHLDGGKISVQTTGNQDNR